MEKFCALTYPVAMRALLVAILVVACSASPALSPRDCTPGATVACACPGASGVQTCGAEGTLGACICADAGVSREDASSRPQDAPPVPDAGTDAPLPALDAPGAPDAPTVPLDAPAADAPVDAPAPRPDVVVCSGLTCGADCIESLQTDPRHCGTCGRRCPAPGPGTVPVCVAGRCSHTCAAGMVPCGATMCADPNRSSFDCRACGFQCPEGRVCRILNAERSECVVP